MSRILVPKAISSPSWFENLSIVSTYSEGDFVSKFLSHAKNAFPGFLISRFYYRFNAAGHAQTRSPDVIFIKNDYSEWWLVEMEKSTDDLRHVEDQLEVFSNPDFNPLHLKEKIIHWFKKYDNTTLDEDKLEHLINSEASSVLLIVDKLTMKWKNRLKKFNFLCEFQVYKNTNNCEIYRLSGKYPIVFQSDSHLKYHSNPNTLVVNNPDLLPKHFDDFYIILNGYKSRWRKVTGHRDLIRLMGSSHPLTPPTEYVLKLDLNDNLHFQLN